ncbi:MAG: hypothetical protein KGN00_09980, partial [Chloroflexota bacterium]|nr:hypothetical protein [Chloroflexota bacterium]
GTDPRSFAPYSYALNDPTGRLDRTGLSAHDLFDGGGSDGVSPWTITAGTFGAESEVTVYSVDTKLYYENVSFSAPTAAEPPAACGSGSAKDLLLMCRTSTGPTVHVTPRAPLGPITLITPGAAAGPIIHTTPFPPAGPLDIVDRSPVDPGSDLLRSSPDTSARSPEAKGEESEPIWRIHGGRAPELGHSWTPKDPASLASPRQGLGLPSANTGENVTRGRVRDWTGIFCRRAEPCEGNPGGEIEYWVPDPGSQIEIVDRRQPGEPY